MRAFFWAAVFLAVILAVDFAASNREAVAIQLWPFPYKLDLKLYLLVILLLFVGFFAGRILAWFGAHRLRRELRRKGERITALERELSFRQGQTAGAKEGAFPPPAARG